MGSWWCSSIDVNLTLFSYCYVLVVNVSSLTDSLTYNLRVAGSLFKQVYIAEGLAPPKSFSTIREAYQTMYTRAINPEYWTKMFNNGEWKKFAILSLEAYGIFTIGEMVSVARGRGTRLLKTFKTDYRITFSDWT